jgi:hypothetical protein
MSPVTNAGAADLPKYDGKRCPEACGRLGVIVDRGAVCGEYYPRKTRSRVYECPDCGERWRYYDV